MWRRFLELFSKKVNPTLGWTFKPGHHLTVDLSSLSICGVHLNDSIHPLSILGPTTLRCSNYWIWPEQGIGITVTRSEAENPISVLDADGGGLTEGSKPDSSQLILSGFSVFLRNPSYLNIGVHPYAGEFTLGGRCISIGGMSSDSDLVAFLGPPYLRTADDDLVLFYERANGELVASFEWITDSAGVLSQLMAQTPPLLDLPYARAYYGLDR